MRVAIAGISHETNSYCAELTPAEAFWALRGERVMRARRASTEASSSSL